MSTKKGKAKSTTTQQTEDASQLGSQKMQEEDVPQTQDYDLDPPTEAAGESKKAPKSKVANKKIRISKQDRANITFPPSRSATVLKRHAKRVSPSAAVYLAAVGEYLTSEFLEVLYMARRQEVNLDKNKKFRITDKVMYKALRADEELGRLVGMSTTLGENINVEPFSKNELKDLYHEPELKRRREKARRKRAKLEAKAAEGGGDSETEDEEEEEEELTTTTKPKGDKVSEAPTKPKKPKTKEPAQSTQKGRGKKKTEAADEEEPKQKKTTKKPAKKTGASKKSAKEKPAEEQEEEEGDGKETEEEEVKAKSPKKKTGKTEKRKSTKEKASAPPKKKSKSS